LYSLSGYYGNLAMFSMKENTKIHMVKGSFTLLPNWR
jgi:hypothetical protein